MKKIQVLMSTYNGEKYLREQLDSILSQDCEELGLAELSVIIRDDGSKDGTQKILQEYSEKYPGKLCWVQGKNCGVIQSFFELLVNANTDADYFALADQDDYWMTDKLSSGICALEEYNNGNTKKNCDNLCAESSVSVGKPLLYCCRPKLVDAGLKELPIDIKRPPVRTGFGNALIENVVTGCTVVMNKVLREMIAEELPQFTTMHDRWLYLVASCFGAVIYDEEPHICYRQHGGNVMGTSNSRFAELKERLVRFRKRRTDISRQAAEFLRIFGNLSKESLCSYSDEKRVRECLLMAEELVKGKHSFRKRVCLVRSNKLYRQRKNDNRVFKLLILLGSY